MRVNKVDVGFDTRRSGSLRDVEEESLMLTGDQNIVDVEFSVFWRVKPNSVGDYLFNVANPPGTVKAVAESAMRQVIGHSDAQPLLAGFQQTAAAPVSQGPQPVDVETGAQVQDLMQKTLDSYNAGILVQSVQLQTIQVPAKVIDSFRDVQAANSDLVRAQNEAQTYANRVVPEARGRASKVIQDAEAYRSQTVADATGQASRFTQILQQYKNAPDADPAAHLSRNHGASSRRHRQDHHRYRPAGQFRRAAIPAARQPAAGAAPGPAAIGRQPMRSGYVGIVIAILLLIAAIVGYSTFFTVYQTRQALVVRLGEPVRVITEPGLNVKIPFIDNVIYIDKRILAVEAQAHDLNLQSQDNSSAAQVVGQQIDVDAFARYRITDPLKFYQTVGPGRRRHAACDFPHVGGTARTRQSDAGRCHSQQAR